MSGHVATEQLHDTITACVTVKVKVKMKSTVDDAEWIWDRNKFVNRTYLMKEMFQNYYDGEEDWDVPQVCEFC